MSKENLIGISGAESSIRSKEVLREKCEFCEIPFQKTTDNYRSLYGELPHVLEIPNLSSNWTVLQDVVPVAEDAAHLLLLPNKHRISLATVEDQSDVTNATETLINSLRNFYSNPIFVFEHGPGFIEGEPIACGGCHMDHAHGHFLVLPQNQTLEPIRLKLEEFLGKAGWLNVSSKGIEADDVFSNISNITGMSPYLHIGMVLGDSKESVTYVQKSKTEKVESQLLRKIISDVVFNQPSPTNWHWRDITEGFVDKEKLSQLQNDVVEFRLRTGY